MKNQLSTEQLAAVSDTSKRILVIAAPGSGKTKTMVARVRRLLADGVPSKEICCITFTTAGARVLQDRLEGCRLGYIGTLHAWCLRLLQRHGSLIGLTESITVMDEEESASLLERCRHELKITASDEALEEAVRILRVNKIGTHPTKAMLVAKEYLQRMEQSGEYDFESLLIAATNLLRKHPGVCTFTHTLVDEFQDSAEIDMVIYNAMAACPNWFFVGDLDQNIYTFRGTTILNMMNMINSGVGVLSLHKLTTNYRSAVQIIEVSQAMIRHNHQRVEIAIRPTVAAPLGFVDVRKHQTPNDELVSIAKMASLVSEEQLAVLWRTNAQVDACRQYLQGLGIKLATPRSFKAPGPVERLGKSFLQVLLNPWNDSAMSRYIEFRYGGAKAIQLRELANTKLCSMMQVAQDSKLAFPQVTGDAKNLTFFRDDWSKLLGPQTLVYVHEWLAGIGNTLPEPFTISDIMVAIATKEPEAPDDNGIFVGTAHASKGREWDHVHIGGLEHEAWPGRDTVEEARRLLYVAMTRARLSLTMSWCQTRPLPFAAWKIEERTRSQFISEII